MKLKQMLPLVFWVLLYPIGTVAMAQDTITFRIPAHEVSQADSTAIQLNSSSSVPFNEIDANLEDLIESLQEIVNLFSNRIGELTTDSEEYGVEQITLHLSINAQGGFVVTAGAEAGISLTFGRVQ